MAPLRSAVHIGGADFMDLTQAVSDGPGASR
jgi:hypothetical protein